MYIDCDIQQEEGGTTFDETNIYRKLTQNMFGSATITTPAPKRRQRQRGLGGDSDSGDGDDDDDDNDCSRKVLWAAYHDPGYRGNSIGEYQFYDHVGGGTWDTSTCQSSRCAKMDCHASRSNFELIGVFKEADGLTDWAEQLFKHEGYCIWDGDKDNVEEYEGSGSGDGDGDDGYSSSSSSDYEFMSNRQEYMSQGCYGMYLTDDDGNTIYRGVRPLPGGNITDALYTDEYCTQISAMRFGDYIVKWYTNFYYDEDQGKEIAEQWSQHTLRWNELMMDYHVCQPCRTYNKVPTYEDERRRLTRNLDQNDDGGGDEEQWGYSCYDDAGYRNCNQCYKFETKTDMSPASTQDLERASNQGSILAINVDGVVYGRGGIDWHDIEAEAKAATLWIFGALAVLGIILFLGRHYKKSLLRFGKRVQSRRFQKSLREAFVDEDDDDSYTVEVVVDPDEISLSDHMREELTRNRRLVKDQRREIVQLKSELERSLTKEENEVSVMEQE